MIVAAGGAPRAAELVRSGVVSSARVVFRPAPTPLQVLRASALAEARGEIIAFLDCYAIVEPGWLEALRNSHRRMPHQAIGGPVDLADEDAADLLRWATYINEYGMFLPPLEAREMPLLPGCNLSYKRDALFEGERPRRPEFWKSFVNADLARTPPGLWVESGMAIRLDKPVGFADYCLTRIDHGRCYGAMRGRSMPARERVARTLGAPALPLVLTARWTAEYWPRGRRRSKLLLTLPLQALLFGSWALGEGIGYLLGAGNSCRRLFY